MEVFNGIDEVWLRLSAFIGIFVVMAGLELMIPKRPLSAPKSRRWLTNMAIVAIDSAMVRLLALVAKPLVAVGAALYAESQGWGLFNWTQWPLWLEVLLAIVIFDFLVWFQHLVFHKVPFFWRLHRMHHADVDIDVTTAIRFHPIEIAVSMVWKVIWVFVLGVAPVAVVLFEVILNGGAMFNHANVALPRWLDRILRVVIVTPDMHRVHHSVIRREHDSNYGFNLSIWDRMFGTYTAQPSEGHDGMTIGLESYQSQEPTRLWWNIVLPFRPLKKGG